jgi:hypothetical protein
MRVSLLFFWIIALVIVTSPALAESTVASSATETSPDVNATCRILFEQLKDPKTGQFFRLSAALNENAKLSANLRQRYIVADLNSADESGNCRGVQEYFSPVGELSEFPRLQAIAAARKADIASLAKESLDSLLVSEGPLLASEDTPSDALGLAMELEDLRNYLEQVQRYKTDPVVKPPVFNGYCVGQTLSFCEIVDGQPKLVYRFVTSSSRQIPPYNGYYAPINLINTRNWSSDRRYNAADARRDARMGGGDARIIPFHNGGNPIEMPNFMHFVPVPGYTGGSGNGIHQIAGGLDSGGTFGAPVSLGCIRLNKYQAKLARWWTPRQAKFFVHFEPNRYRNFGDLATSRAKGFQTPRNGAIETVAVTRTPEYRTPPSRSRDDIEPMRRSDAPFNFNPFALFLPR